MRTVIILAAVTFLLSQFACHLKKNDKNCERFKNGKFLYHSEDANSYTIITRTDSIQTERDSATGKILYSKIKWLGPCEYELRLWKGSAPFSDTVYEYLRSYPVNTKIVKAENEYYIFESTTEGSDVKLIDTMKVLN